MSKISRLFCQQIRLNARQNRCSTKQCFLTPIQLSAFYTASGGRGSSGQNRPPSTGKIWSRRSCDGLLQSLWHIVLKVSTNLFFKLVGKTDIRIKNCQNSRNIPSASSVPKNLIWEYHKNPGEVLMSWGASRRHQGSNIFRNRAPTQVGRQGTCFTCEESYPCSEFPLEWIGTAQHRLCLWKFSDISGSFIDRNALKSIIFCNIFGSKVVSNLRLMYCQKHHEIFPSEAKFFLGGITCRFLASGKFTFKFKMEHKVKKHGYEPDTVYNIFIAFRTLIYYFLTQKK